MRHKKSEHNETQTSRERFVFHIDTTKPEITLQDFIEISKSLEVTCKSVSALVLILLMEYWKNTQIMMLNIMQERLAELLQIVLVAFILRQWIN